MPYRRDLELYYDLAASVSTLHDVDCVSDVVEAVAVLEAIEDNEGDARLQLDAVRALRQRLTKLAIE